MNYNVDFSWLFDNNDGKIRHCIIVVADVQIITISTEEVSVDISCKCKERGSF